MRIKVSVQKLDALQTPCDVLALKYANAFYGVDDMVAKRLERNGVNLTQLLPKPWGFRLIDSSGEVAAKAILFVGVGPLRQFGYREIREFSRKVLVSLAGANPAVRQICLTAHGAGYGLDETEAFVAEIAGLVDAVRDGDFPEQLKQIIVAEQNPGRADRLKSILTLLLPSGVIKPDTTHLPNLSNISSERLQKVGYDSENKPRVFVAMPFAEEMDDVFFYGIQGPVNEAGFLCERADMSTFVGDVLDWVKRRISNCELVVADLSGANPNVYLEVGYAWGCNKSTILLVRGAPELKFDVQGQRCIVYKNIKALEKSLRGALAPFEHKAFS
jgi:hypothetical protein